MNHHLSHLGQVSVFRRPDPPEEPNQRIKRDDRDWHYFAQPADEGAPTIPGRAFSRMSAMSAGHEVLSFRRHPGRRNEPRTRAEAVIRLNSMFKTEDFEPKR